MRKGFEIAVISLLVVIAALLAINLIVNDKGPLDLTGEWTEFRGTNILDYVGSSEYYSAKIYDNVVEVYINNTEGRSVLFYSGTYDKPKTSNEPYTWTSQNEYRVTESLLFPIQDETVDFSYDDGTLTLSREYPELAMYRKGAYVISFRKQ